MSIKNKESVLFDVNAKMYPFESVLGAAYSFLDRAHVFLDGNPSTQIKVQLKLKKEALRCNPEDLKGEFYNELLEQNLRLQLTKDNKKLREYIVGQALFGASPESAQPSVSQQEDELDKILERELKALEEEEKKISKTGKDPLGVLTAWDQKKEKKTATNKKKKK